MAAPRSSLSRSTSKSESSSTAQFSAINLTGRVFKFVVDAATSVLRAVFSSLKIPGLFTPKVSTQLSFINASPDLMAPILPGAVMGLSINGAYQVFQLPANPISLPAAIPIPVKVFGNFATRMTSIEAGVIVGGQIISPLYVNQELDAGTSQFDVLNLHPAVMPEIQSAPVSVPLL